MWHLVSKYLILNSKDIELKNFGKFTVVESNAKIEGGTIKPKTKKFGFAFTQPPHTTEEFLDYLIQELNLEPNKVEEYVDQNISEALKKLENNEKITLPIIGYLQKLENGDIKLNQTNTHSLEPNNFGFTEIQIPEQIEQKTSKKQSKTAKSKTKTKKSKQRPAKTHATEQQTAPKKQNKQKVKLTTTKTKTSKQNKSTKKSLFIAIIAIAAIVVLGVFLRQPITKAIGSLKSAKIDTAKQVTSTQTQPQNFSTTHDTTSNQVQSQVTSTEETTSTHDKNTLTKQQEEQIFSQIPIKPYINIGPSYKRYYLIAGSFSSLSNANRFKNNLIAEGYSGATVITADPKFKRVAIGGFNDPDSVISAYNDYIRRFPDKDLWLLINAEK